MTTERMQASATAQGTNQSPPSSLGSLAGADPRSAPEFAATFYPLADGQTAPPGEPEGRDDAIRIEFCTVYYHLNRLQARLADLRRNTPSAGVESEREIMEQIEKYLQLRDALEDHYAPYGVIAEPILEAGLTVDLKFTFGHDSVLRRQRTQLVSSSALILFGPEGDPLSAFIGTTL